MKRVTIQFKVPTEMALARHLHHGDEGMNKRHIRNGYMRLCGRRATASAVGYDLALSQMKEHQLRDYATFCAQCLHGAKEFFPTPITESKE